MLNMPGISLHPSDAVEIVLDTDTVTVTADIVLGDAYQPSGSFHVPTNLFPISTL